MAHVLEGTPGVLFRRFKLLGTQVQQRGSDVGGIVQAVCYRLDGRIDVEVAAPGSDSPKVLDANTLVMVNTQPARRQPEYRMEDHPDLLRA